jgi:hypothetical protein
VYILRIDTSLYGAREPPDSFRACPAFRDSYPGLRVSTRWMFLFELLYASSLSLRVCLSVVSVGVPLVC